MGTCNGGMSSTCLAYAGLPCMHPYRTPFTPAGVLSQTAPQLTIRPHPDINRAGFSDLTQTKGADYVITAADVEQVNAAARQKLASGLMNSD